MSINRNKIIWISAAVVLLIAVILIGRTTVTSEKFYTVKPVHFELAINTKGEVRGKNAVVISLPDALRRRDLRIYQLKLKDMVQEGTMVKKGDWVATLDAAAITERLQNNKQDLDRRRAELNDAKIDSAIQLTALREELREFKYDLEYQKIELEQAKYESPAYQRKQQMNYNRTLRQMDKKKRDYELKRLNLKTKTRRIEERFDRYQKMDELYKKALASTRVTAPKKGMVMYAKLWNGKKLKVGDEVNIWMPTIATLPDMSVLVSETYIKEIDISKVAIGDSVEVLIDALPGNKYSGTISKIANIGQEIPGYDTKVFKVAIDLNEHSKEIKPAMTTNNNIIVESYDDVLAIPRRCLFTQNEESFVFMKENGEIIKKRVTPGTENEEEVIIVSGLKESDKILQKVPENADEIPFITGS